MMRIGLGAVTSEAIPGAAMRLISDIENRGDGWRPERFGFFEPIKSAFTSISELGNAWAQAKYPTLYLVRKKRTRYQCTFSPAKPPRLGSVVFSFDENDVTESDLVPLFERVCDVLLPEIAYLHWRSDMEVQRELGDASLRSNASPIGVFTEDATQGLKTMFWMTYFGQRYVRQFGRDFFSSLPVEKVNDLSNGVALQLSKALVYNDAEYGALHENRLQCIRRFGREFFRDGEFVKQAFATPEAPWIPPKLSK